MALSREVPSSGALHRSSYTAEEGNQRLIFEVFLKGFCFHFRLDRSVCRQVAVGDWELCCYNCTSHESGAADGFVARHRLFGVWRCVLLFSP